MIASVASRPDRLAAVALLEDEDEIPNATPSETRFSNTAFSASTTERNARISRMNVSRTTNASTYRKFPYTACTKSRSSGAVPPSVSVVSAEPRLEREDVVLDPSDLVSRASGRPVGGGERLDQRGPSPARPAGRRARDPLAPRLRTTTSAPGEALSASTTNGFITPAEMPARERLAPTNASPLAGEVLRLGLARVHLEAGRGAACRRSTRPTSHRPGAADDVAPTGARSPSSRSGRRSASGARAAVDPGAEHREQRGQRA